MNKGGLPQRRLWGEGLLRFLISLLSLIAVSRWHAFFGLRTSLVSFYNDFPHIKYISQSMEVADFSPYRKRKEEAKDCSKKSSGSSHTLTHPAANHRRLCMSTWCQKSKDSANDHCYHLSTPYTRNSLSHRVQLSASLISLLPQFHL